LSGHPVYDESPSFHDVHSTFPILASRNIWTFKDFSFHLNVWIDIGKISQY
jgi:hypothetical protein